VLQARSDIDATSDVCGVIGLDNVFAAVIESTVANDKAVSSLGKAPLVVLGNRIAHNRQTCAVVPAMPRRAVDSEPSSKWPIDFGEGAGFGLAVIPTETTSLGQLLRSF